MTEVMEVFYNKEDGQQLSSESAAFRFDRLQFLGVKTKQFVLPPRCVPAGRH